MIKYIFCIVFFLLCSLCFGQEIVGMNLGFSSGYSFYAAKEDNNYTFQNGIPFQISFAIHSNNIIYSDVFCSFIYMPGKVNIAAEEAYRLDNDSESLMYGMEIYYGFGLHLFNTEKIKVPFTAGIHLKGTFIYADDNKSYYISFIENTYGRDEYEFNDYYFGLGFNLGMQFYVNNRIYLFGRIQGAFDFINYQETIVTVRWATAFGKTGTDIYSNRNTRFTAAWGVSPHLGIGIRLM